MIRATAWERKAHRLHASVLTVSKAELERLRLRKVLAHKRTDELAQDLVSKLLTLGFTQADAVLTSPT